MHKGDGFSAKPLRKKHISLPKCLLRPWSGRTVLTFGKHPKKTANISRRNHWFPREMTSEERVQKFHTDAYPDLACASYLSSKWDICYNAKRCRYPSVEVTRHQYGFSALVSQTSFRGETSGGVANVSCFPSIRLC